MLASAQPSRRPYMTRGVAEFRKLFQPGKIGSLELRNRLVMTGMGNNLVENSTVNERLIAYYEERARGGVAMIVVGACQINQGLAKWNDLTLGIGEERFLPGLRRLAEVIRVHGAIAAIQLIHAGGFAAPGGATPISASSFTSGHSKQTTRALAVDEIKDVEQEFAIAAARARDAGFQAVELNCCSGYLIREFLSPRTNKREDSYGGPLSNRLRFLLEVLEAVRGAVGPDFPVLCRLTGDEFLEGGNGLDEAIKIALAVEAAGAAAVDVTVGGHETAVPLTPGMVPGAAFAYYAQQIKRAVKIPVIYATRVSSVDLAERILREGKADFAGMVRALNADPLLPRKAMEGRADEIIPCACCHQGCYDQLFSNKPIFCLANPRTAYEREREIRPAQRAKRVLVVGGGPGGMEAAIVAARRGHRVTLVDRAQRPGGQLDVLSAPPGKQEFRVLRDHMERELRRAGVEVVLGREVTAEAVIEMAPEEVVVAAGSRPAGLPVPGADLPHVHSAHDVLRNEVDLGDRVVVVGGNAVGIETALYAAAKGALDPDAAVYLAQVGAWGAQAALERTKRARQVTVLEMLGRAGTDLGRTTRWSTMLAARSAGIAVVTEAKVMEITPLEVVFEKGGERRRVAADTVVLAVGARAEQGLAEELEGRVPVVRVIGDAVQPRKAADAIREGFLVGCEM